MSDYFDKLFEAHLTEAFGEHKDDFTVQLKRHLRVFWLLALKTRTGDEMTVADEDRFVHGIVAKRYPALLKDSPRGFGPASNRDVSGAACRSCRGTGLGDYPHQCTSCGGDGNG